MSWAAFAEDEEEKVFPAKFFSRHLSPTKASPSPHRRLNTSMVSQERYIVLSPNEEEKVRKDKEKQLRLQRLLQVREQSKRHAGQKLKRAREQESVV
jgi:hypothetical protein